MRHGKAHAKVEGQQDSLRKLSPEGEEQAQIRQAEFSKKGIKFDRVYSSPFDRAVQTAQIASAGLYSGEIIQIPQLVHAGTPYEDRMNEMFKDPKVGGGVRALAEYRENNIYWDDFMNWAFNAAFAVYQQIKNAHCENDSNVLVVGHGPLQNAVALRFLKILDVDYERHFDEISPVLSESQAIVINIDCGTVTGIERIE